MKKPGLPRLLARFPSRHPAEVTVETEDGEGVVQIEGTPEQVAEVTGVGKDDSQGRRKAHTPDMDGDDVRTPP